MTFPYIVVCCFFDTRTHQLNVEAKNAEAARAIGRNWASQEGVLHAVQRLDVYRSTPRGRVLVLSSLVNYEHPTASEAKS